MRARLRCAFALSAPLSVFGVDRARFRALLEAMLVDEARAGGREDGDGAQVSSLAGHGLMLLVYLAASLFLAGALYDIPEPMVGLTLVLGVIMVFVMASVLGTSGSAMLRTDDLDVLAGLPVCGRTIVAARTAPVLFTIAVVVLSLGAVPLAAGIARFGAAFAVGFVPAAVLAGATSSGIVLAALTLAVRVLRPAHVRAALLTLQTGGVILMFWSIQLAPVLIRTSPDVSVNSAPVLPWILPPAHAAALATKLMGWSPAPPFSLVVVAVALPVALFGVVAVASARLGSQFAVIAAARRPTARTPRGTCYLRDLVVREPRARAGYDFAAVHAARDAMFQMRAWPVIAFSWFLAAWLVWRGPAVASGDPSIACSALYCVGFGMPHMIRCASFSEDWQARWIFSVAPLPSPAVLAHGAAVAMVTRFIVPVGMLTFVVVLFVGGFAVAADAVFALLAFLSLSLTVLLVSEWRIPFTQRFDVSKLRGSIVANLLFSLSAAALAAAHVLVRRQGTIFFCVIGVFVFAVALLFRRVTKPRNDG